MADFFNPAGRNISGALELGRDRRLGRQTQDLLGAIPTADPFASPEFQELARVSPEAAQKFVQTQGAVANLIGTEDTKRQQAFFDDVKRAGVYVKNERPDLAFDLLSNRRQMLGNIEGANTELTEEGLEMLMNGDTEGFLEAVDMIGQLEKATIEVDAKRQAEIGEIEAKTGKLEAEEAQIRKETAAIGEDITVPPELLPDDPELANKAAAAYRSAGGGKDGINAMTKIIDEGTEQQRREASPELLKQSFPNATPAELNQLQATMDAAKDTESGLKAADKIRVEQRRMKKAQAFQGRALDLIDNILVNDQLPDVLGSIEGAYDFRLFSDAESELISDIEEAQNILTADNMDLMTGVLSESDIKLLKNLSSGALNRKRSLQRFTSDLTQMRNKLASQTVQTIDDKAKASVSNLPQGSIDNGDGTFTLPDGRKVRLKGG